MARYIKAVECADIISERFNISLDDLVDVFAEIPTADVAPKSEVAREIFESIEECIYLYYNKNDYTMPNIEEDIAELKKKYTEDKK